jgi:NADH-quinone oxidoreductase subunit G
LDIKYGKNNLIGIEKIDIVATFATHKSDALLACANIILPITTSFETDGSFINIAGKIQRFNAVIQPKYQSKPLWKILRVLANLLSLENFDYLNTDQIYCEWHSKISDFSWEFDDSIFKEKFTPKPTKFSFLPVLSIYQNGALVRQAEPLQLTKDAKMSVKARISPDVFDSFGLNYNDKNIYRFCFDRQVFIIPVTVDPQLAPGTIILPFAKVPLELYSAKKFMIKSVDNDSKEVSA